MKKLFLFYVVLLLSGWSCTKRKYPESYSENAPVFYFKGNINNKAVEFNAGVANYRMFSSYELDSNNMYNLFAELKGKDCANNCPNSIKIQINDFKISAPGTSVKIDSTLIPGNYSYLNDRSGSSFTIAFTNLCNKEALSYKWNFGDGSISAEANPTHVYKQKGKYNVCLEVIGKNGYVGSICNSINLTSSESLNAFINANRVLGDTVNFEATVLAGKLPYQHVWDFGDGSQSTLPSPQHVYKVSGSYPVNLKLTDGKGETINTVYNVVTQNDVSSFAVNYKIAMFREIKNAMAPSKIIINYTDENGIVYSSVNPNQPGTSSFELEEVSNYEPNENNQNTKKLKIKFSCMVYNGNQSLSINNAETVIAVAYK